MGLTTEPALPPGSMAGRAQPTIEGERVVLRPWRAADFRAVLAGYRDPGIQKWHVRTMDEAEARTWIAHWPGRWRDESGAGWAVTADDGVIVGQISLTRLDLHAARGWISYWTLPEARGSGVAHRALVALSGWAGSFGLHRLEVAHSTANPASCRVAEKAGFAAEGVRRGDGWHADGWHDMHIHSRIAP